MVWVQLAIAAVLFVVGELLRKPPPDAQAANFEDFGFPDIDPTKRIPIIWGKKRITGIHTLDVQGYRTRKIKASSGLFSSSVIGFNYYAGVCLGICRGPNVTVKEIRLGDRLVWAGTAPFTADGFVINVDIRDFNGDENDIKGVIRLYGGGPTQLANAWFKAKHDAAGTPTPAYRHLCYAAFEDFKWGTSPTIGQIEFIVERYPDTLALGANRLINTGPTESPTPGAVDLAIPEILYEILTNNDWGLGEPSGEIDTASFTDAAATLRTEANAMSLVWSNGDSIHGLMQIIMQQADGFVFKRLDTAQWEINLARPTYLLGSPVNSGSILTFSEENSSLIRYTRGNWTETFNAVNVNWSTRDLKGKPAPAVAQDMANYDIQGSTQLANYTFPGCASKTLANYLANRQLRATSYPLAMAEITTNRLAWNLNPGDIVVFQWLDLGITKIYMRISKIAYGTPEQGEIRLSLMEDVFGTANAVFAVPQKSLASKQSSLPINVVTAYVKDQPRFIADLDPNNASLSEKPMILALAPQGNSLEYIPNAKLSSLTNYVEQATRFGFAAQGTLARGYHLDAVEMSPAGVDPYTIKKLRINNVSSTTDIVTPITTSQQKELGAGFILIESTGSPQQHDYEILSYDSATVSGSTVTLTSVHRGLLDTVPRKSHTGDKVWFMEGVTGTTVDVYGNTDVVNVKLDNIATTGSTGVATASVFTVTMRRRTDRPTLPKNIKIGSNHDSPNVRAYPVRYKYTHITKPGNILMTWNRHNITSGQMRFQTDADQAPTNWSCEVKIYKVVAGVKTLLRTAQETTQTFTYTKAMQRADGVFHRYFITFRAYDNTESPRLASIEYDTRKMLYNAPAMSPVPSPVPTAFNSPRPSPFGGPTSPLPVAFVPFA